MSTTLGALCAIDTKSHSFSEYEIEIMQRLAKIVMDDLEMRKASMREEQHADGRSEPTSPA